MDSDKVLRQQPLNEFQAADIKRWISFFAHEVAQCERDHGWLEDPETGEPLNRNTGEAIALMHSELSEALEAVRNSEPHLWYRESDGKPEGIAAEFADTIIRILAFSLDKGIPTIQALIEKHNHNIGRPYRHGGKTA